MHLSSYNFLSFASIPSKDPTSQVCLRTFYVTITVLKSKYQTQGQENASKLSALKQSRTWSSIRPMNTHTHACTHPPRAHTCGIWTALWKYFWTRIFWKTNVFGWPCFRIKINVFSLIPHNQIVTYCSIRLSTKN